jgi:shikimate dehydrogenase
MIKASTSAHYAVIGNPVSHSLSPQIHARFSAQTGKPLRYTRLLAPQDSFARVANDFAAAGGRGLNVTAPFKQEAYTLAAPHLSTPARLAGAVNTLSYLHGKWHGCNTDGLGLVNDLLRLGLHLQGTRTLLIGAGGAARGVLYALASAGCTPIHIVNRHPARATDLAAAYVASEVTPSAQVSAGALADAGILGGWDLVINASASGLQNTALVLPKGLYAPGAMAYDMMYGAQTSAFLHDAQADGATHIADGLGMLVNQAAESFFIWHGLRPDPNPVLAALRASLAPAH